MTNFLIVSKADGLSEYSKIAAEYGVGYEYNDFFNPEVLDDAELQDSIINKYRESKVPEYCTMHGAFFDVIPFSYDSRIRAVSEERMIQSMEIARRIGAKAVVFHTNANPFLTSEKYIEQMVLATSEFVGKLLDEYRDINIYLENMFDSSPDILRKISEQLVKYPNYGICFDYACLYVSMARAAGLKVRLVTGEAFDGNSYGSHAWNQVYLSDERRWINVDTTFYISGDYFDSNLFEEDHIEGEIAGEW